MEATVKKQSMVNGIDVDALKGVIRDVTADPAKGMVEFRVKSQWKGQARTETEVESFKIGGQQVRRRFKMTVDEPFELLGENTAANPQEVLMTALNSCIMVGYVVGAAVNVMVGYVAGAAARGITLEKLELETAGELDLRGFLGIDEKVPPGYEAIHYTVRIKGNGTPEQFRKIHDTVIKTSPNYFNVSRPIRIDADLVVQK
jgi:uncharacterized OsmC-like protein